MCHCTKLCTNSLTLHAQAGCCATPTLQAMQATPPTSLPLGVDPRLLALVGGLVLLAAAVKKLLDTPSRTYNSDAPNVGDEYDSWTQCAPCCVNAFVEEPEIVPAGSPLGSRLFTATACMDC